MAGKNLDKGRAWINSLRNILFDGWLIWIELMSSSFLETYDGDMEMDAVGFSPASKWTLSGLT
jgi:hypothetical protein